MPIAKDYVWAAGFFDAAALWPDASFISSGSLSNYYFSLGLGIRFVLPQFPIRVFLARTFKVDQSGNVAWQSGDFSIGGVGFKLVISLGGSTQF